jgi:hypothetical protein
LKKMSLYQRFRIGLFSSQHEVLDGFEVDEVLQGEVEQSHVCAFERPVQVVDLQEVAGNAEREQSVESKLAGYREGLVVRRNRLRADEVQIEFDEADRGKVNRMVFRVKGVLEEFVILEEGLAIADVLGHIVVKFDARSGIVAVHHLDQSLVVDL